MGFLREGISEVIATTRGPAGPNAAPMGFISRGGRLSVVLFHGSHTLENIRRSGKVVANLTHDPVVYVKSAFFDLPSEDFSDIEAGGERLPRLKECEAWMAFRAEIVHEGKESCIAELTLISEETLLCLPQAFSRGFASVIEAAVHATRYVRTHDPRLREMIEHHLAVARKCGGEREEEAVGMLRGIVGD